MMITKEKALEITKRYLGDKKRDYTEIDKLDKVIYSKNEEVLYGKYAGELMDVYSVGYGQYWGLEIASMFVVISANNGEVLYSMSPTSWIEELEQEDKED